MKEIITFLIGIALLLPVKSNAACNGADVVVIFDESQVVGFFDHESQKTFAETFLNSRTIGDDDTRISVLSYSTQTATLLDFSSDLNDIINAIDNAPLVNQLSCPACALLNAYNQFTANGRTGVEKIVLIFHDGSPNEQVALIPFARDMLEGLGVKIFAIGSDFPSGVDPTGLAAIASDLLPVQTVFPNYTNPTPFINTYNQLLPEFPDSDHDGIADCEDGCPNGVLQITCPDNIQICAQTRIGSEVSFSLPLVSDNCTATSLTGDHEPGEIFPIGTTLVNYTASDAANYRTKCSFTITVKPTSPVTIAASPLPGFCQGDALQLTAVADGASFLWSTGQENSTIHVYSDGTYSVTANNDNGCTTTADYVVSGFNSADFLSSYVIIAEKEVDLHSSTVISGGIGLLHEKGEAKLHDNTLITGPATFVKAPELKKNGGSIIDTYLPGQASLALPAFQSNPYNSHNDIVAPPNTVTTLTESIYGKIELKENAEVNFTKDAVFIKELKTKKNTVLRFNQCASIIIDKKMDLDEFTTLNPDNKEVHIYAERVKIDKGSKISAAIYASKEIDVKGDEKKQTSMVGMFIAEKVKGDKNTVWSWNTNCNACSPLDERYSAGKTTPDENRIINPTINKESDQSAESLMMDVYPNPFSENTTIEFKSVATLHLKVDIFSLDGKLITTLYDDISESNINQALTFNAGSLRNGMYLCRLASESGEVKIKKLFLMR